MLLLTIPWLAHIYLPLSYRVSVPWECAGITRRVLQPFPLLVQSHGLCNAAYLYFLLLAPVYNHGKGTWKMVLFIIECSLYILQYNYLTCIN